MEKLQLQNYYFQYQQEHLSVEIRSNKKLYNYHSIACDEALRQHIQVLSPQVKAIRRMDNVTYINQKPVGSITF